MEVVCIKKILAWNLPIYIGLHCVRRSSWTVTTLAILLCILNNKLWTLNITYWIHTTNFLRDTIRVMGGPFWNRVYYRTKKNYFNRNAGRYANVNIHWQFTRNNSWWALDPAHFDPSALSSRPGCNCNSLMLLSLALLFHYSTLYNWVKSFLKPHSKVHIVWEGHNILQNLHLTFVVCSANQK